MSRARPIELPTGERLWFDTHRNSEKATEVQLELLASALDVDLDDILDENLSQGDVLTKLRAMLGQGIPPEVLERRRRWREQRSHQPACRMCGRVGDSTKHHFINKWILKELDGYHHKWADRRTNCIPLCIRCHRDIHSRANGSHSIAQYLTDDEKRFADRALTAFVDERPAIAWLVVRGDDEVYETRLMRDWIEGKFIVKGQSVIDDRQLLAHVAR